MYFQLYDKFLCILSEFGWILAIVSLGLKWEEVSFGFLLCFGVAFGLKGDFLVKNGKSVLVNQIWKRNLSFWCIFGHWMISGSNFLWVFSLFWGCIWFKRKFSGKKGKSVLVNQIWKRNLSFCCIFGYWVIYGFDFL